MPSLVDHLYRLAYKVAHPLVLPVWWVLGRDLRGVFVAVWCEGRVLMVRNSYKRTCCFPGGMIDAGETPDIAGARELREEVGVQVDPAALRHVQDLIRSHGGGRIRSHAYILELDLPEQPAVHIDDREIVWAAFQTPQQALALPLPQGLEAYIRDAATARGCA